MGINSMVKKLNNDIVSIVNTCGLPPSIIRLVLKDILSQVDGLEKAAIAEEIKKEQEQPVDQPEKEED